MSRFRVVYLGLGSNVGLRKKNIVKAINHISSDSNFRLIKSSSFYETSAIGPKQNKFINAVIKAETKYSPTRLLEEVKAIELKMGRLPDGKVWGPRIIDIDILIFGRKIIMLSGLKVPHTEIMNRLFVLVPLAEISPGLVVPDKRISVRKARDQAVLTFPGQKVKLTR